MSEGKQINDGFAGPPGEKPVFNPKQEVLSKELVIQKAKKLGEKLLYIMGAGMKRNVIIQNPEGKEVTRVPLTLAIIIIILSQFILLPVAAVMVVFFKWKMELESPPSNTPPTSQPPQETPPPTSEPPASSASQYPEPTLPPMPT